MSIESPAQARRERAENAARIYYTALGATDRIRRTPMPSRRPIAHVSLVSHVWRVALCGLVLLACAVGCATVPAGATAEDLARAHNQAAAGATTFTNECATCHGQRGEGLGSAPAILGPGAL